MGVAGVAPAGPLTGWAWLGGHGCAVLPGRRVLRGSLWVARGPVERDEGGTGDADPAAGVRRGGAPRLGEEGRGRPRGVRGSRVAEHRPAAQGARRPAVRPDRVRDRVDRKSTRL